MADLPRPERSPLADVPLTFRSGDGDPVRLADGPGTWVVIDVAAPAARVWDLVSDIELPARFSGEFLGAEWTGDGPALGATFVGRNTHPDVGEWEITSHLDAYEPGRTFGWATVDPDAPGSRWRYDVEPTGDDTCRLRYSVTFGPGPSFLTVVIERMPDREERIVVTRLREHHANMRHTVEGIAALAEAG